MKKTFILLSTTKTITPAMENDIKLFLQTYIGILPTEISSGNEDIDFTRVSLCGSGNQPNWGGAMKNMFGMFG
jgi:hypothetical protein